MVSRGALVGIAMAFAIVASASVPAAAQVNILGRQVHSGNFMDLAALDCSGGIHLFPSQALVHTSLHLGWNNGILTVLGDLLIRTARQRALCHCPQLSDEQLDHFFGFDVPSLIRFVRGEYDYDFLRCAYKKDTRFVWTIQDWARDVGAELDLGITCTVDGYMRGEPCLFRVVLPNAAGSEIQVGVSRCPKTEVPFVSVSCAGPLCNALFRPCTTDADCQPDGAADPKGEIKCMEWSPGATEGVQRWLTERLDDLKVFGADPSLEGACDATTPGTVGKQALDTLVDWARTFMFNDMFGDTGCDTGGEACEKKEQEASAAGAKQQAPGMRFCGLNVLAQFDELNGWLTDAFSAPLGDGSHELKEGAFGQCPEEMRRPAGKKDPTCIGYNMRPLPWNGIMANGEPVFSAERLAGLYFSPAHYRPYHANGLPILDLSCASKLTFMQESPLTFALRLPRVNRLLNLAQGFFHRLQECRSSGHPNLHMDFPEFARAFLPWVPDVWLYAFTASSAGDAEAGAFTIPGADAGGAPTPVVGATPSDHVKGLAWQRWEVPKECDYAAWVNTGVCHFSFSGLGKLLGNGVELRVSIVRCGGHAMNALPSINVDCYSNEGKLTDCRDTFEPYHADVCGPDMPADGAGPAPTGNEAPDTLGAVAPVADCVGVVAEGQTECAAAAKWFGAAAVDAEPSSLQAAWLAFCQDVEGAEEARCNAAGAFYIDWIHKERAKNAVEPESTCQGGAKTCSEDTLDTLRDSYLPKFGEYFWGMGDSLRAPLVRVGVSDPSAVDAAQLGRLSAELAAALRDPPPAVAATLVTGQNSYLGSAGAKLATHGSCAPVGHGEWAFSDKWSWDDLSGYALERRVFSSRTACLQYAPDMVPTPVPVPTCTNPPDCDEDKAPPTPAPPPPPPDTPGRLAGLVMETRRAGRIIDGTAQTRDDGTVGLSLSSLQVDVFYSDAFPHEGNPLLVWEDCSCFRPPTDNTTAAWSFDSETDCSGAAECAMLSWTFPVRVTDLAFPGAKGLVMTGRGTLRATFQGDLMSDGAIGAQYFTKGSIQTYQLDAYRMPWASTMTKYI